MADAGISAQEAIWIGCRSRRNGSSIPKKTTKEARSWDLHPGTQMQMPVHSVVGAKDTTARVTFETRRAAYGGSIQDVL
jgi:hypothetical protein